MGIAALSIARRRAGVSTPVLAVAALLALLLAASARSDVVLLDEYWAPEIQVADTGVVEIDAEEMGDPALARSGTVSARLQNLTGAPNVRFRGSSPITLAEIPPGQSEVSLWYRTDGWDGTWRLAIWAYHEPPAPVQALEALLDGGGAGGRLVADGEWHQARGILRKGTDYDGLPQDVQLVSYVWLTPEGGWNTPHVTLIDRAEITVVDGPLRGRPAPEPPRRVRPEPGRVTAGEGWLWWEAEDATDHDVPAGGAFQASTSEQQELLSGAAWLQYQPDLEWSATWEIDVPEDSRYVLWSRNMGFDFVWSWDDDEPQVCNAETPRVEWVLLRRQGGAEIELTWACLGEIELTKGKHTLHAAAPADGEKGVGLDCWFLTSSPLAPRGAEKPDRPEEQARDVPP
jgi:hypothetical protein